MVVHTSGCPWLKDLAVSLVDAKRAAQGIPMEMETTIAGSAGLAAAYHDYTDRSENARSQADIQAVVEESQRSHETRGSGEQHSSSQDQRRCLGLGCAGQGELFR